MAEKERSTLSPLPLDAEETLERLLLLSRYAQVGRCVDGATHDINNALGAALAYAELIQLDQGLSEDSRRMLERTSEAIERCSHLVSQLTNLGRSDAWMDSVCDPAELVQDVVLTREYALKRGNIAIQTDYEPNVPSVVADAQQVRLAVLYLLMNAQEAVEGAAERVIRVRVYSAQAGCCIEVWNAGAVVPEHDRAALAEPLTTSKGDHHLGLGLHAVARTAKRLGGTLAYTPEAGFRVCFPNAGS